MKYLKKFEEISNDGIDHTMKDYGPRNWDNVSLEEHGLTVRTCSKCGYKYVSEKNRNNLCKVCTQK